MARKIKQRGQLAGEFDGASDGCLLGGSVSSGEIPAERRYGPNDVD